MSHGAEKESLRVKISGTVPETDTGRRDENSKAYERTRVKELGKIHT